MRKRPDIIARGMADKLLGGAAAVLAAAEGLAKHLVWYVSYQIDGTARSESGRAQGKRS